MKIHHVTPTDAEIREKIDGAFSFIDLVLENQTFREGLPRRARVVVARPGNRIDEMRFRAWAHASRPKHGQRKVVVYAPESRTAYVIDSKHRFRRSQKVFSTSVRTVEKSND
jgi:hypothetical protein